MRLGMFGIFVPLSLSRVNVVRQIQLIGLLEHAM